MKNIEKLKKDFINYDEEQISNLFTKKICDIVNANDCCSNFSCKDCIKKWLNQDEETEKEKRTWYVYRVRFHDKMKEYITYNVNNTDRESIFYSLTTDFCKKELYTYAEAVSVRDCLNENRKGHLYLYEIRNDDYNFYK